MPNEKTEQQRVMRVTQSPMNALRWCLDLECGHEEWVTRKTRPAIETVRTLKRPEVFNGIQLHAGERVSSRRRVTCSTCAAQSREIANG